MDYTDQNGKLDFGENEILEAKKAAISGDKIVAYLGKKKVLIDFNGRVIGTYKVTHTWKTPKSYVSTSYNQILAVVDGIKYTGRSAGENMLFKGKRVAKQ